MMGLPAAIVAFIHSSASSGVVMASNISSTRDCTAPWRGPDSDAKPETMHAREVGAGGGRHPGRERRGVEAVVDGEDAVGLDRLGEDRVIGPGDHPEVPGDMAEILPRCDRLAVVDGCHERRQRADQPDGVGAPLRRVEVDKGAQAQRGAEHADGAAQVEAPDETGHRVRRARSPSSGSALPSSTSAATSSKRHDVARSTADRPR